MSTGNICGRLDNVSSCVRKKYSRDDICDARDSKVQNFRCDKCKMITK